MEKIQFFLPGPTYVPEDARQAMAKPIVSHRSAGFRSFYQSVSSRLQGVLRTQGDAPHRHRQLQFLIMESAVLSTAAADVLSLTCGAFSERWHAITRGAGKQADRLTVPWGEAVDPDLVRAALRRKRYDAVTLVHNETSTGVMNPLADLARVIRDESDALILVDAVSSLGGAPIEADEWGIDVVLAGTQKALALPPGLVVFTFSDRAAERAAKVERRASTPICCATATSIGRRSGAITTPAISLFYALDVQLDRIGGGGDGGALGAPCPALRADRGVGRGTRLHLRFGGVGPLAHRFPPAAARGDRPASAGQAPREPRLDGGRRLRRLEADDLPHRSHGRGAGERPRGSAGRDRRGHGGARRQAVSGAGQRILIADSLDSSGLQLLAASGAEVVGASRRANGRGSPS